VPPPNAPPEGAPERVPPAGPAPAGASPANAGERAGEGPREAGEGVGEHEEREEEEPRATVGLDLVLGWGHVPFAVQNAPSNVSPDVTYTRADAVSSNVQSLLLYGSMEVVEHVGVGARFPLTFASFSPDGASQSVSSPGNLELEGEYAARVGPRLRVVGSLGVALPTASGSEIPADLNATPARQVDSSTYDRFSLSRAAASARGFEDNALFEPNRLGVVPKVAAIYSVRGLTIEPSVKVENLIGTSSDLEARYVGELVGALRAGYWVQRHVELALRGFVNVGFAGTAEDKKAALALEPMGMLRFGPIRPYVGVIIPVAGPPSENKFIAVRLGIAGAI
jgi:hypothetical protein